MYKIVLIGAGTIGKRHLQSLLDLADKAEIYVVENNKQAYLNVKTEFEGTMCVADVRELPEELDVAIIATTSSVRRQVFESLIVHTKVHNIVFEKVLFQKEEDYYWVEQKLKDYRIKAWVNCARREWDAYHWLKDKMKNTEQFTYSYVDSNWGLACNGIHMIDIIQFLGGGQPVVDSSYILPGVIPSKRLGFYEFYGTIVGSCGKCKFFQLTCTDSEAPQVNEILGDNIQIRIDETNQTVQIAEKDKGWNWEEYPFRQMYQSQLTARVVMDIIEKGECRLVDYKQSMNEHLKYIAAISDYFYREGMEKQICPIT